MHPVAVLISDIHYNLANLELADKAMRQAIKKANDLEVPLIVAGDLHDSKANLRGECVNAMTETFKLCKKKPYVKIGNHDKINEKSEEHSLNFLRPYATIIDGIACWPDLGISMIAYMPSREDFKEMFSYLNKTIKTVIAHQGLQSSNMGDYIQDKSAITKEDVAGFRVISGHYHARQTIDLPDGGKWDYIGSPFTMTYGEANDPPKGFQILMSDGSLEFIPTNLRKHVIYEIESIDYTIKNPKRKHVSGDLVWVKLHHKKEEPWPKVAVGMSMGLTEDFRLDMIPTDTVTQAPAQKLSQVELLDSLIDSLTGTSEQRKVRLKELWRNIGT